MSKGISNNLNGLKSEFKLNSNPKLEVFEIDNTYNHHRLIKKQIVRIWGDEIEVDGPILGMMEYILPKSNKFIKYLEKVRVVFTESQLFIYGTFSNDVYSSIWNKFNKIRKLYPTLIEYSVLEEINIVEKGDEYYFQLLADESEFLFETSLMGFSNAKKASLFGDFICELSAMNVENNLNQEKAQNIIAEIKTVYDQAKYVDDFDDGIIKSLQKKFSTLDDEFSSFLNEEEVYMFHYYYALFLLEYSSKEQALLEINKLIDAEYELSISLELKGEILMRLGRNSEAILLFNDALGLVLSNEGIIRLNNFIQEAYENIIEKWDDMAVHKKQVIIILEDIKPIDSTTFVPIYIDKLPANIVFPAGHPQLHQAYTINPLNPNHYRPIAEYEENFFRDRIDEFRYLAQCLGAKKIVYKTNNSLKEAENTMRNTKAGVEVDYKVTNVNIDVGYKKNDGIQSESMTTYDFEQDYKPNCMPYVPNDLIWFHEEKSWQRLAQQRMKHDLLKHNELVTSKQNVIINKETALKIEAEVKTLLPNVSVNFNHDKESNTSQENHFECSIEIVFESIEDLALKYGVTDGGKITDVKSSIRAEFMEEVNFMLENDGVIDDAENRLLQRKMDKLGMTSTEGEAIIRELIHNRFSDAEKEYIKLFKQLVAIGELNENIREVLNQAARKSNISIERQTELEIFQ